MALENENPALADSPEQRPMRSLFGQPPAGHEPIPADVEIVDASGNLPLRDSLLRDSPLRDSPLRDSPLRDKSDRFARDINAKIDALEEQLERSSLLADSNQNEVRRALEELRDHLARQRNDLDAQRADIDTQRAALTASHEEILAHGTAIADHNDQLGHHLYTLRQQSESLDAQQAVVDSQRKTLDQMGQNLAAQNGALSTHTSALSTHNERIEQHENLLASQTAQVDALDQRQVELHHTLLGLSQEHDTTANKVDALADQVYDHNVQFVAHRNDTRTLFRTLTGALIGTTVLTIGLIAYFTLNPVATTSAVENHLATLNADMAQQRDTTNTLSGELQRIGSGLTALEGSVTDLHAAQSDLHAGQQASRDEIGRISSQISSYERNLNELRSRVQRVQQGAAPRTAARAGSVNVRNSAWFASRPGNHYVIQLASASDHNGLVRYASQNARALGKYPLSSVMTSPNGQRRHALMYGDFATRQQAKNALAALPANVRASKPWIRQIRSVR